MKLSEAARLANYANAMLGRTEPSDMQVYTWLDALEDISYDDARAAVVSYIQDPQRRDFFTVADIRDRVVGAARMLPHQIEGDVRSARTRGLIARDWPTTRPLPADVAEKLAAVRAGELEAQRVLIIEGGLAGEPIDTGLMFREVPRA